MTQYSNDSNDLAQPSPCQTAPLCTACESTQVFANARQMRYKTRVNDQEDPITSGQADDDFDPQDSLNEALETDATEGDQDSYSDTAGHLPVLIEPLLELFAPHLNPNASQSMLDCTLGRGGHASILAQRLSPQSHYIGLDVDPENIAFSKDRLASVPDACAFTAVYSNFANASAAIAGQGVEKVDLLLADLGFASNQMDDPSRGFSFANDGPLDMRLDPDLPQSAADLVNHLPAEELADIIYQYGEERLSRKIARKIVEERNHQPILTTETLARIVRHAYGPAANNRNNNRGGKGSKANKGSKGSKQGKSIHPATKTFMALRIAVNGELDVLDKLLSDLPALMKPNGVAAIISFHSLEDRRVKQAFLKLEHDELAKRLTRKPLIASDEEMRNNPRSRSAKLRAVQFAAND